MNHTPEADTGLLPQARIDDLGHVLVAGAAAPDSPNFNPKIDVLSYEREGADRAQIYQMWVVDAFASNDVAFTALKDFGLAGLGVIGKENWTQLLEHIGGVTAIAVHLNGLLGKYGASQVDNDMLRAAAVIDNVEKPLAIAAGLEMLSLRTGTLVHDIEKPAELDAGKKMADSGESAGGLENSRDNPVLRAGRLWTYLLDKGVDQQIILAAQNTGRSDRYFGELSEYDDNGLKKALEDRDNLESLLREEGSNLTRADIDAMSSDERRQASITAKGLLAAVVGISDAMAAQFRFQGISQAAIDTMAAYYMTYKKDPESQQFFGHDWPAYYKIVRAYLIENVPETNRAAFAAELDALTEKQIFNKTVLPAVLGSQGNRAAHQTLRYDPAA